MESKPVKKIFPTVCPSCGQELQVKSLHCGACDTTITGEYRLSPFMRLAPDEQHFLLEFIKSSGSLKEMAAMLSLSYPTVRNKLDAIIENLKRLEEHESDH